MVEWDGLGNDDRASTKDVRTVHMNGERQISDLQLASYLLVRGYKLVRVEGPPTRRTFIFPGVPEEVVFNFYSGEDLVSARHLFDAYRNLKGLTLQRL